MKTFSIESKLDWERILEGDGLASSQASQQSDYLRNIDLGLDIDDFDFRLQSQSQNDDHICRNEIKPEPDTPMDDVIEQLLYGGSDETAQQLSPATIEAELQQLMPSVPDVPKQQATEQSSESTTCTVDDDIIRENFPDNLYSVSSVETADADEVIPSPSVIEDDYDDVHDDDDVHGDDYDDTVESTTKLDAESNFTSIISKSRKALSKKLDRSERSSYFTDDYLRRVGTKEFNRRIQELCLPLDEVKKWKRRRRTLKNRGYAQNCRQRRVGRHMAADEENMNLRRELAEERAKSARLQQRIALLEASLAAIAANNK